MLAGNNHSLTPGIKLIYSDLKSIVTKKEEEMGYLLYSGKSVKTGEVHHIRVFNENSKMAQENLSQAMTIFLRETLRLCALNKGLIIQETLEFHENKLCYVVKPVTSPILAKDIDLPRMMEDLIEDLKHLRYLGIAQIEESQIWFSESSENSDNCSKIQYFVQDWNQVLWKSQEKEEKKLVDPNFATITSTMGRDVNEKETIYNSSLIAGVNREGLESLKERKGPLYQRNIRIDVEELLEKTKNCFNRNTKSLKGSTSPKIPADLALSMPPTANCISG